MSNDSRLTQVETFACNGNIEKLRELFNPGYTQPEIDTALDNAIAYSQTETAEYLLSLGADFSTYGYAGVYYAVHNNEMKGLKFAIERGVDINIQNGMLINTSIMTATNTKSIEIVKWLLENGANPKLLTKQSLKLVHDYGMEELKNLIQRVT